MEVVIDGDDTIHEGDIIDVQQLDKAGLPRTDALYVRGSTIGLWKELSRPTSCLVQGPPGVGKSTAVWFWLLARLKALELNSRVLWCHFRATGTSTYVIISLQGEELQFVPSKPRGLATFGKFAICVMDGVRQSNLEKVNGLCDELDYDQTVWVSSQQIVITEETLIELGWVEVSFSSWTSDEINAYAAAMGEPTKAELVADFKDAMADRLDDGRDYSFEDVVGIKTWFFGGSARYMFGLRMEQALRDLKKHVAKINDVELIFRGLTGSCGLLSVNHLISHFPGTEKEFGLISPYVIELLSEKIGFAAIKMFYRSSWVQANPSIHGFVFEWDLFTQIKQHGRLILSSNVESPMDTTWTVDENISLKRFLAGTSTEARIMVRPEKWNDPEFDGLYIHSNQQGEREMVAWNASEAVKHTGSVTKLRVILQELGNRLPANHPLVFDKVRFVFIVPTKNLGTFQLPNDSAALMARNQLMGWRFSGFEILGGKRTTEDALEA